MLVNQNRKLGKDVFAFNIPAVKTCPGATKSCKKVCYALRDSKRYRSVTASHERNLLAAEDKMFVDNMVAEIVKYKANGKLKAVRIHSSGDFYSVSYINKWIKIIAAVPDVSFLAYTRSWSCDRLRPSLEKLQKLPNLNLWASYDRDATLCPPETWPAAYMSQSDDDLPTMGAKMVFRTKRRTLKKSMGGVPVCLKERVSPPHEYASKVENATCGTCRMCFNLAKK